MTRPIAIGEFSNADSFIDCMLFSRWLSVARGTGFCGRGGLSIFAELQGCRAVPVRARVCPSLYFLIAWCPCSVMRTATSLLLIFSGAVAWSPPPAVSPHRSAAHPSRARHIVNTVSWNELTAATQTFRADLRMLTAAVERGNAHKECLSPIFRAINSLVDDVFAVGTQRRDGLWTEEDDLAFREREAAIASSQRRTVPIVDDGKDDDDDDFYEELLLGCSTAVPKATSDVDAAQLTRALYAELRARQLHGDQASEDE